MKSIIIIIVSLVFFPTLLFSQTWQQIGPEGGYFKEFTFHPANSSIIYVGSDDGGGIWKSIDNGSTWSLTTKNYPNMTGWFIAIDENSPETLYGCDVYGRYGVLKSSNGGLNWTQKSNGLNTVYDKMVSGLTIKTPDTLFISTGESSTGNPPRPGNGVFKSYNGGNSWIPGGLQGVTVPCINKNVFGTIFAGTETIGLQYTNNNGLNWIRHPDVNSTSIIHEIDVKDSVIVVASSTGIYLSTNWGINFMNIGLSSDFNFDISIHKLAPNIELFCPTLTGLQQYSSATSSWSLITNSLLDGQLVIGLSSNGTTIYLGTFSNSPIIKSIDGGTNWTNTPTSPIATELNDVYIDPVNPNKILSCLLGTYNIGGKYNKECIYETNNGGGSWQRKGPLAHSLCLTVNPLNSNKFYLGTFSQGLFKTNDNFDTFTNLITGNKLIGDVAVSQSDTNIIIISEVDLDLIQASIKRSTNSGSNFTTVATLAANRLLFNTNNNDTVYAATDNGIHISIDSGVSWNSWLLNGLNVLSIAYENNVLYAGTDQGLFYRIENSIANNITGGWQTPTEVKSIYVLNQTIFIGLNGAEKDTLNDLHGSIWKSNDNGATWNNITLQMTSSNIYGNNLITSNGSDLLLGTYGGGIFRSNGLTLNIEETNLNNGISLFPNPTSNYLQIKLKSGNITSIKIINSLGQDFSNYLDKKSFFGKKEMIDLSPLPNGLYIVLTEINGTIITAGKVCKQ